jgi:hypothetical protein
VNEKERLEKRITEQAKSVLTQIEQQRSAAKKLIENEAEYKTEKARLVQERSLAEQKKKKELFGSG